MTIPVNATATVYLPVRRGQSLTESGKPVLAGGFGGCANGSATRQPLTESGKPLQEADGPKLRGFLTPPGEAAAIIEVGSGSYHFQARDAVKPH